MKLLAILGMGAVSSCVAFSTQHPPQHSKRVTCLNAQTNDCFQKTALVAAVSFCLFTPFRAFADEYGKEVEAPTFSTGETVEVSKIQIEMNKKWVGKLPYYFTFYLFIYFFIHSLLT